MLILEAIPHLSTTSLKAMHEALGRVRDADKNTAHLPEPFGTKFWADWQQETDAIEAELTSRGEHFTPIVF